MKVNNTYDMYFIYIACSDSRKELITILTIQKNVLDTLESLWT